MTLTNLLLFLILVCLFFICNLHWEDYMDRVKGTNKDVKFFQNFGVTILYVLVCVTALYYLINYFV
jgi:1,4-dihydroxy-2-naphthoate octaprenyltransferase